MMSVLSSSYVSVIVILVLLENVKSGTLVLPQCQNQGITFTEEPADVEVGCGSDDVAIFSCRYEGTTALAQWIINSTEYSSLNSQLPPDHFYSAHTLRVTNLSTKNGSVYQCQLLFTEEGHLCVYRSSIGRLIAICNVLDVHCLPHYLKSSESNLDILKSVHTTVTQVDNYESFYTVKYSDYNSGQNCAFATIPASSCVDGSCSIVVDLLKASMCPNTSDISINVTISNSFSYGYFPTSQRIKIDAANNFIRVSFDDAHATINLKFINQPTETEKVYTVKYGPANPGCKDLPLQMKGHLTNSNYISIELNVSKDDRSEICFSVIVSNINGAEMISIEGTHIFMSTISVSVMKTVLVTTSILVVCLSLSLIFVTLITIIYCHFRYARVMSMNGGQERIKEHHTESYQNMEEETSFKEAEDDNIIREIDLSTTFFRLCTVPNDCSMSEFASSHDPPFEPYYGFGFYKSAHKEVKDIQPHKKIIMMDKLENKGLVPRWTAKKATIQDQSDISGRDIYIQDKSSNRKLLKGSSFLYCARSKVIAACWEKFLVTKECRESEFLRENISGYQPEWICYGYIEFTKPEHIKPNQRVIVIKEDDKIVTGPGVRHLINAMGDGSTQTQPPNLEDHNEWKHVFLQNDGIDRMLTEGTQYLFCAAMNRIDAHYSIHEIPEHCDDTLESYGKRHVPGFRSESGYGYFEFTEPEYLKPHKNVILMDKEGKLFTGAGAKFFYTGLKYDKDKKLRESEISPPSLDGTRWKHIFIQSHSKKREVQPNTKFLYCEYNAPTPHLN